MISHKLKESHQTHIWCPKHYEKTIKLENSDEIYNVIIWSTYYVPHNKSDQSPVEKLCKTWEYAATEQKTIQSQINKTNKQTNEQTKRNDNTPKRKQQQHQQQTTPS